MIWRRDGTSLSVFLGFLPLILISTVFCIKLAHATDSSNDIGSSVLAAEKWLSDHRQHHLDRLIDFLRIESVSADPARAHAVRDAASFLLEELAEAGMQNVQLLNSSRHPSVFAEWKPTKASSPSKVTTILLYAHYDVQPEDPISKWTKTKDTPFDPVIDYDTNRIYARGASDDKGHLYTVVAALRAWIASTNESESTHNLHIKVLFEGEEEIGSPNLRTILQTHADLLKADFGFSADGGMVDEETPNICVSLRGALAIEVNVRVAHSDMHSGTFGGGVMNPVIALSYLISGLRDAKTGKVLVKGFYDKVRKITKEDKKDMQSYPVAISDILNPLGVNESVGEEGFNFRERTWARPSLDVLGVYGGFTGVGVKTVLPREATAKISSRIVADQTAAETATLIEEHIKTAAKAMLGVHVTTKNLGFSSDPAYIPKSSAGNMVATKVLKHLYNGKEPVFVRFGGSIPAIGLLRKELGVATSMFSFALGDENVHAPDEFARIDQLRRSEVAYVRLFGEILKLSHDCNSSAECNSSGLKDDL